MAGCNTFCFKRFAIDQEGCAMKVSTDGVLLGAWCRVAPSNDKHILDIGTGTGVIALQLAQRTETGATRATIDAVEIDGSSCRRAQENFGKSPWSDSLKLHHASIQEFTERNAFSARYDHIVSNPPYFIDSLASPDALRTTARHSFSLSYHDLIKCCSRLLTPGDFASRISLIMPAGVETEKMIAAAGTHGFAVSRRTDVYSTPVSGPKRTLLEFSHNADTTASAVPESTSLVIQDAGPGAFSAEYRALTRDFYLYF